MSYGINLGKWNSIFAIPSEIAEKYLKTTNEVQIKVILWLLCYAGKKFDEKTISYEIGFSEKETQDALFYWRDKGFVIDLSQEKINNMDISKNQESKTCAIYDKPSTQIRRYQRPDSLYMAERMQKSDDVKFLMQEAQVVLGRPLSGGDSATLLMLHDNDGLPVDVILMILQYAMSVGKAGMKYVEKIGAQWAAQGIDNLEKAEKKIMSLNQVNVLWKKFENIIGIEHRAPTGREEEAVIRWFSEWNYCEELIKEAYERCVNANGKYILKYMDSIIKRWHTQGIFTPEQAWSENAKRKKKSNVSNEKTNPSYNIEEYESYNIFDYIKN